MVQIFRPKQIQVLAPWFVKLSKVFDHSHYCFFLSHLVAMIRWLEKRKHWRRTSFSDLKLVKILRPDLTLSVEGTCIRLPAKTSILGPRHIMRTTLTAVFTTVTTTWTVWLYFKRFVDKINLHHIQCNWKRYPGFELSAVKHKLCKFHSFIY